MFSNFFIVKFEIIRGNQKKMSYLTAKEKLQMIVKMSDKFDIKPYEFGNNTSISTFAARNVLNGTTKKPSIRTIDAMYNYVKAKSLGSEAGDTEEEYTIPGRKSVEDLVAEKVVREMFPLLSRLSEYLKELIMRDNVRKSELADIKEDLEEINKLLSIKNRN